MILKIFIDTDALIALNDVSDGSHKKALQILKLLAKGSYIPYLSTNILLEALTIVSQKIGKTQALKLLDELRSGKYMVIHPDEKTIFIAEDLFRSITSKNISYSDCLSFVVARKYGISWIFSFDIHFKKQGFKRLKIDGFPKNL